VPNGVRSYRRSWFYRDIGVQPLTPSQCIILTKEVGKTELNGEPVVSRKSKRPWSTKNQAPLCPLCGAPKIFRLGYAPHGGSNVRINAFYCPECKGLLKLRPAIVQEKGV